MRYITSAELLQDLTACLADHTLPERLRYYSNFDLLAIDEFGFDRIERSESSRAASLLYKVVDGRTKRSTAMVTNISFEAWAEYLGDALLAMAVLDRVVDGAIILKIEGLSHRASRVKRPVRPTRTPERRSSFPNQRRKYLGLLSVWEEVRRWRSLPKFLHDDSAEHKHAFDGIPVRKLDAAFAVRTGPGLHDLAEHVFHAEAQFPIRPESRERSRTGKTTRFRSRRHASLGGSEFVVEARETEKPRPRHLHQPSVVSRRAITILLKDNRTTEN